MDYRELTPSPALTPYVRCYWTLRAPFHVGAPAQRVLPDGCVEMILNLGARFLRHDPHGGAERQPRALLVGPTTRSMSIAPTGAIRLVGIRFTPGGAFPFLTVPPEELRDTAPSLEDVALPFERSLADRLAAATFGDEAPILDLALARHVSRARRIADWRVASCVRAAFAAHGSMRVDAFVALTGLGARQLERRFRATVGFGPKTVCRLARFQRVVRALDPYPVTNLARVAAGAGYADQAHMARDFREFAGTSVTDYVRELHPLSDRFHAVSNT